MQTSKPDTKQDHPLLADSITMANRLLIFTAKSAWKGFKGLFHIAVRLPGLFTAAARHSPDKNREARKSSQL